MDLVFIKFPSNLNDPRIRAYIKNDCCRVIPIMPKAALEMADQGYADVKLPIDFLDIAVKQTIDDQAFDLSGAWHASFHSDLFFHGIDLADCCRLQMLAFFQDVLTAEKIWPILLQLYDPDRAVFMTVPSVSSYDQTMHNGTADVFEAVFQWRLSQKGVRIQILNPNAGPKTKPVKSITPSDAFYPGRIPMDDLPADQDLVAGLGDDYDLLFLWPYVKSLAAAMGAYPFSLNALPTLAVNTLRSGLKQEALIPFLFVNDIPIDYSLPASLKSARGRCLDALKQNDFFPVPLRNPLLHFQFATFFDVFIPGCVKAVLRAEYLFSRFNLKLHMDDYCISHICRAWTATARNFGVKTATVSHSAVAQLTEFNDFNADYALVWGQLSKTNFEWTSAQKKDRILKVGNPSMQSFPQPHRKDLSNKKSILLATGGFLQQVWTDFSLTRFFHTWEAIFEHIARQPAVRFIVKPHPSYRDFGYWYKRQIDLRHCSNLFYADDKRLEDMLADIGLLVMVGKPGTAPLVSMLHSVPVVYLDCLLNRKVKGYEVWVQNGYVPYFDSVEDLFALIAEITSDRSRYMQLTQTNIAFADFILSPFQPRDLVNQLGLNATAPSLHLPA
ncbi:MAG: hypothetical protein V2A77_03955 [Pseudomonadota bacterium]